MMDLNETSLPENTDQEVNFVENASEKDDEKNMSKNDIKMTKEEIISQLQVLIEKNIDEIKDEVESLKQTYYKLHKQEIEEKKKDIVSGDEEESENKPEVNNEVIDPLDEELKNLLAKYKEKKTKFLQEIEQTKEANLERKRAIIEEIKTLSEDSDAINKHYNRFQELQQTFKSITDIPASSVTDTWKSYQNAIEKFYDLLKINKELRDYDFKKNLELKIALCESAEELAKNEENIIDTFKSLQLLHDKWREIGPVAKELRDEIWTRFKNASTIINKGHQQYFETIKAQEQENESKKIAICEEIEAIKLDELKTFAGWDEKTKEIIDMQERWKEIGFASRKTNNLLFDRFRKSCDLFFQGKADFFHQAKDEMNKNLQKKKVLCEEAEALKESTDWKATTDRLIAIQKEWKQIGSVNKKYSDQIWKRFISACDYFFEQKAKQFSEQKQVEQENLQRKRNIIQQLNEIDVNLIATEAIKLVRQYMTEWNEVGHVPFKDKDKIYREYQTCLDKHFERLNIDESKRKIKSYDSTIRQMASSEQPNKILKERDKLLRQYEQIKNDVNTYENNMGFLNVSSKNGGGMLKEMERKISKLKDEMELIAQKIEVIDQNL